MPEAAFVVENSESIFINCSRDAIKCILHIFKRHFY